SGTASAGKSISPASIAECSVWAIASESFSGFTCPSLAIVFWLGTFNAVFHLIDYPRRPHISSWLVFEVRCSWTACTAVAQFSTPASVAQGIERLPPEQKATGSIPVDR